VKSAESGKVGYRSHSSGTIRQAAAMKTTRYFEEQVLRKRPYIERGWCAEVIAAPIRKEVQDDGRIRHWGRITQPGDVSPRFLRVITLEDGKTVHNAFFDRGFREEDDT
jgi:hypothetical protein